MQNSEQTLNHKQSEEEASSQPTKRGSGGNGRANHNIQQLSGQEGGQAPASAQNKQRNAMVTTRKQNLLSKELQQQQEGLRNQQATNQKDILEEDKESKYDTSPGKEDDGDGNQNKQSMSQASLESGNNKSSQEGGIKKRRRRRTNHLTQLKDSNGLSQDDYQNSDLNRRSRREHLKKPDHFQQQYCHHCNKLEVNDSLLRCRNDICGVYFCFGCLKKCIPSLRLKHDFQKLRTEGIACPICTQRCNCKSCNKANIIDDISKIKNDQHDNYSSQPTSATTRQNQNTHHSDSKIQISTSKVGANNIQQSNSKKMDKEKHEREYQDSANMYNLSLKQKDPDFKMFVTTKVGQPGQILPNSALNLQFKYSVPVNPFQDLKHAFSELKYDSQMKPDFRGFPPCMEDEYTEEEFDYDDRKGELAILRESEVCQEKIDCKETIKTVIVKALKCMHTNSSQISIDGITFTEKPDINVLNYLQFPAYKEWTNKIEQITAQQSQARANQQPKFINNIKVKDLSSKKGVMDIGMSNSLVGTKRALENASQQRIVGQKLFENHENEQYVAKRRKLDEDHSLSQQPLATLPASQQDSHHHADGTKEIHYKEVEEVKQPAQQQQELSAPKLQIVQKPAYVADQNAQKPIFSVSAPINQNKIQNSFSHGDRSKPITEHSVSVPDHATSAKIPSAERLEGKPLSSVENSHAAETALLKSTQQKITMAQKSAGPHSTSAQEEEKSQARRAHMINPQVARIHPGVQPDLSQLPPGLMPQQVVVCLQPQPQFVQSTAGTQTMPQFIQQPFQQAVYAPPVMTSNGYQYQPMVAQSPFGANPQMGQGQIVIAGPDGQPLPPQQQFYMPGQPQITYGYIQGPNGQGQLIPIQTSQPQQVPATVTVQQPGGMPQGQQPQYAYMTANGQQVIVAQNGQMPMQQQAQSQQQQAYISQGQIPIQIASSMNGQPVYYVQAQPQQSPEGGQQVYMVSSQNPTAVTQATSLGQAMQEGSVYQQSALQQIQYQQPCQAIVNVQQLQSDLQQQETQIDTDLLSSQLRQDGSNIQNLQGYVGMNGQPIIQYIQQLGQQQQPVMLYDPANQTFVPIEAPVQQPQYQIINTMSGQQIRHGQMPTIIAQQDGIYQYQPAAIDMSHYEQSQQVQQQQQQVIQQQQQQPHQECMHQQPGQQQYYQYNQEMTSQPHHHHGHDMCGVCHKTKPNMPKQHMTSQQRSSSFVDEYGQQRSQPKGNEINYGGNSQQPKQILRLNKIKFVQDYSAVQCQPMIQPSYMPSQVQIAAQPQIQPQPTVMIAQSNETTRYNNPPQSQAQQTPRSSMQEQVHKVIHVQGNQMEAKRSSQQIFQTSQIPHQPFTQAVIKQQTQSMNIKQSSHYQPKQQQINQEEELTTDFIPTMQIRSQPLQLPIDEKEKYIEPVFKTQIVQEQPPLVQRQPTQQSLLASLREPEEIKDKQGQSLNPIDILQRHGLQNEIEHQQTEAVVRQVQQFQYYQPPSTEVSPQQQQQHQPQPPQQQQHQPQPQQHQPQPQPQQQQQQSQPQRAQQIYNLVPPSLNQKIQETVNEDLDHQLANLQGHFNKMYYDSQQKVQNQQQQSQNMIDPNLMPTTQNSQNQQFQ